MGSLHRVGEGGRVYGTQWTSGTGLPSLSRAVPGGHRSPGYKYPKGGGYGGHLLCLGSDSMDLKYGLAMRKLEKC